MNTNNTADKTTRGIANYIRNLPAGTARVERSISMDILDGRMIGEDDSDALVVLLNIEAPAGVTIEVVGNSFFGETGAALLARVSAPCEELADLWEARAKHHIAVTLRDIFKA